MDKLKNQGVDLQKPKISYLNEISCLLYRIEHWQRTVDVGIVSKIIVNIPGSVIPVEVKLLITIHTQVTGNNAEKIM